ncbi:MAG: RiPP maturation radical SAM C-methyltransferase [Deltaproteobacteria bacterium]
MIHRVALLSTPWPLFNRPSIQLGALKAYLQKELPQVKVDARHLYVEAAQALGYGLYQPISERAWLSEACYAALLYPRQREVLKSFWKKQAKNLGPRTDFKDLTLSLKAISKRLLLSARWTSYPLIGFSICYGQLTSSLYFIRQIKKRSPRSRIVVGGSSCAGRLGESLLKVFPEIDFVASGEGELPLLRLVKSLSTGSGKRTSPSAVGLLARGSGSAEGFSQVGRLDDLPIPDYTDYFEYLKTLSEPKRFLPRLPVEMSRGCWWGRPTLPQQAKGCAFCNLNLQWQGYRSKSAGKVVQEIDSLTARYELLSVSFMDNLLPPENLRSLFETLAGLGRDLRLFAEIRATTSLDELVAMGAAGVAEVQVGIEALSTRLLPKLNKGTTAIGNMEIMKNCEARNVPNLISNLITQIPGSDENDVEETLNALQYAMPFRPLKAAPFWLGYGSPVWHHPGAFGIRKVHNHPFYRYLFPQEVLSRLCLLLQGYEGIMKKQQHLWSRVTQALRSWKTAYDSLHNASNPDPILFYQDGGTYLIIRERRLNGHDRTHRLRGSSRQIYLFCEANRSLSQIVVRFPSFGQDKILPFLNMMVDKKLMFREGERFLSLAVPIRGFTNKFEI